MKAIVITKYGSPEVLQLKNIEKPVPKDNEVLIRIHGAAVNSTDPVFRKGDPLISRLFTGLRKPKKAIPGDSLAGEIETAGKDVTKFKEGDHIYGATGMNLGAHAEYICLAEDEALAVKPSNMTYEEAAAIVDGGLTALPFLRDKGKIQKGQTVCVNGASGSVGTAAVQLARYYGALVTGVCSTASIELVKSIGADRVIDYTREDFTSGKEKYDIIFDTVGKSSFSQCKKALKHKGIYLTTVPTPGVVIQIVLTIIGNGRKAVTAAAGMRPAYQKAQDLVFLKELIEAGIIKAVIDRYYTLDQMAEAHRYVETGHKKGNVVITADLNIVP